jgi:mono/diheme cytochrome c family protein
VTPGPAAALTGVLLAATCCGAKEPPEAAVGRRIYVERCAPCHGDEGRGDGPAAAALEPRPRNLHEPALWDGRGPDRLRDVVQHGKPGTMMQPFQGVLSDGEIDAVIEYLGRFRPTAGPGSGRRDGEASFARLGEDTAGGPARGDDSLPALHGVRR